MKRLKLLACWLFISGSVASCQSAPYRKVEIGAEKGQVLHLLGNPKHTYRKNGTDRWVYKMKDDSGAIVDKEIWFENSRVVYQDSEKTVKTSIQPPAGGAFEPVQ